MQRRGRETIDKQWSVCTRPFTQCARLQCMYTPTVGAHLGSLCMRALPHFGLGILAIPCDTMRGYMCVKPRETPRNPAIPARYQRDCIIFNTVLYLINNNTYNTQYTAIHAVLCNPDGDRRTGTDGRTDGRTETDGRRRTARHGPPRPVTLCTAMQ